MCMHLPQYSLAVAKFSWKVKLKVLKAKPDKKPNPTVYTPALSGPVRVVSTNPNSENNTNRNP